MYKLITIILIFGSSFCYSQNWIFRWTSTFKPTSIGFYQSSYKSGSNEYFFFKSEQESAISNITSGVWSTFDHFIDVYELNEKWLFGFGFGRNVSFSYISAHVQSYNTDFGNEKIRLNYSGYGHSSGFMEDPLKFSLSAKRKLYPIRPRIHQSIAVHLDFLYNDVDGRYEGPYEDFRQPDDWYYIETTDEAYSNGIGKGRISPGLSLRYEIAFMTKKNKNLLNLNFTYAQGFMKNYASRKFEAHGIDGYGATASGEVPYMLAETTSRGSNFSIGISKTITLNLLKFKQEKTHEKNSSTSLL